MAMEGKASSRGSPPSQMRRDNFTAKLRQQSSVHTGARELSKLNEFCKSSITTHMLRGTRKPTPNVQVKACFKVTDLKVARPHENNYKIYGLLLSQGHSYRFIVLEFASNAIAMEFIARLHMASKEMALRSRSGSTFNTRPRGAQGNSDKETPKSTGSDVTTTSPQQAEQATPPPIPPRMPAPKPRAATTPRSRPLQPTASRNSTDMSTTPKPPRPVRLKQFHCKVEGEEEEVEEGKETEEEEVEEEEEEVEEEEAEEDEEEELEREVEQQQRAHGETSPEQGQDLMWEFQNGHLPAPTLVPTQYDPHGWAAWFDQLEKATPVPRTAVSNPRQAPS